MAYTVNLKRSSEKELDNLPKEIQNRITKRIISLKENPRPVGIKKLQGREGYRIRVGNYRILYTIDDSLKNVEILSILLREDAY
jgi:mRNA interferase RelE/StbE